LASFDPRREAFAEIVACHKTSELFALDLKPLGNSHVESARDGGDDTADRARRMSDDAPRQAALPSMLIAMALSRSRPVNVALVKWLPSTSSRASQSEMKRRRSWG